MRPGFEGGQMPLIRRVPKLKGFKNPNRVEYAPVNVEILEKYFDGEVTPEALYRHGLAHKGAKVKVLARGDLDKKLTVKAHAFSKAAREKIEAAGGTAEVLS
jgi:large subunit ribosomal protein L15